MIVYFIAMDFPISLSFTKNIDDMPDYRTNRIKNTVISYKKESTYLTDIR